jgi:hypothetical protein
VNTKGLARCYDSLTAWERFPLQLAALNRGDDAEAERLARTAPTRSFLVSHHFHLWDAFSFLSAVQLLMQLERIRCLLAAGVIVTREGKEEKLHSYLRMLTTRLTRDADAWDLLCGEMKIDSDAIMRRLRGCDLVRNMEEAARGIARTLAGAGEAPEAQSESPAAVATGMRGFLEDQARQWGV